jgi:carbamoyl-phosphate synthase small subunit
MRALLLLENGSIFEGNSLGAIGTSVGEVVFNTSMSGYQEILTDPSYKGQIVSMTYTQIGNYGVNVKDSESSKPYVEGFIVKEASDIASNFRSEEPLDSYLKKYKIVGISNIDTRKLTKMIREKGSLVGVLTSDNKGIDELKSIISSYSIIEKDMVQYVTTNNSYEFDESLFSFDFQNCKSSRILNNKKVVVIDFGVKNNILKYLNSVGFEVFVISAYSTFDEIASLSPDAIFLSNGPGDPRGIENKWIKEYRKALEVYPAFGICFGHQIIARCFDLNVYKMKFGHHGGNHPVKDLLNGTIAVTAQNHNYAVEEDSLLKNGFEVTHINLNDNSIEGMKHSRLPIMSVQHHPEASPGPHDAEYLFQRFASMLN